MGNRIVDPSWTAEQPMPMPAVFRLINAVGRILPRSMPKLTPEWILERASKQFGMTDPGDPGFLEAMRALLDSYRKESGAALLYRQSFRMIMVRQAIIRLAVVDFLKRLPEIEETAIKKPLFIVGLPRTGTTLLHHLLGQDPHGRPLLHWEARVPAPPPDPETYDSDNRIEQERAGLQGLYDRFPQLGAIHYVESDGPDECYHLFQNAFATDVYNYFIHLPSYRDWLMGYDMHGAYAFYKKQLQLLSWKFPEQHWVLKAPMHLPFLDVLLDTFPDASVIHTHRDPVEIVPSMCSFAVFLRRMTSGYYQPLKTARQIESHLEEIMNRAAAMRERLPGERFHDLSYRALIDDPIAAVRGIYERFGYEYTDEFEERMKAWLEKNKAHQNKYGKHVYSMEQFELEPNALRDKFARYIETYKPYL